MRRRRRSANGGAASAPRRARPVEPPRKARTLLSWAQRWLRLLGGFACALYVGSLSSAHAAEGPERELNCLALNVYHEARNQPIEGQLAVAHVTLNRMDADGSAGICEIVYRGGAFSWTRDPSKHRRPADQQAWMIARGVARWALADRDADPVRGSTYFHSIAVAPRWAPAMVRVRQIGDHIFYRDGSTQQAEATTAELRETR